MPAKHAAFEHFVQTGEIDLILPSKEIPMPRMTPYFTYEVGVDEPPHPDRDIAQRFVEMAMSDCKYGCKIYADPYSEVRVLVHSAVYGCRKTMAMLAEERKDGKIRPGDTVEFDPYDGDTDFSLTGKVLNYLEPDDTGFKGGFHIGCYYVVPEKDVRASSPGETYQQAYERLWRDGVMDVNRIASHLGISVEALKAMNLKMPEDLYDGTEFQPGDMVKFKDFETDETRLGQIIAYISPHFDSEDLPEETYGGYHIRTDKRHPVSKDPQYCIVYRKGALSLAE
jgi:hypothetical protein